MFTSPFELLLRLRFVFAVVVVTRADVGELWVRVRMMLWSAGSEAGNGRGGDPIVQQGLETCQTGQVSQPPPPPHCWEPLSPKIVRRVRGLEDQSSNPP